MVESSPWAELPSIKRLQTMVDIILDICPIMIENSSIVFINGLGRSE
tara:strand:+ start:1360 stop:1500 length:141 start_codon:yes stop_codon:yes gene_type:complete